MKKGFIIIALLLAATFAKAQVKPAVQDTTVYETVETSAEFPGGLEGFYKFIGANIKYPQRVKTAGINARIFVSFVVEKDGALSHSQILRGVAPDIDSSALDVVKLSPKWTPGKQNSSVVRQLYSIPISFNVQRDTVPEVFLPVEVSAEYPGGIEQLFRYISTATKYPAKAKADNVSGKVFVTFVVEKDGSLTDIKVLKSLSPETDAEALRVVRASKKWMPGRINGVPVRQQYSFPVNFIIIDK